MGTNKEERKGGYEGGVFTPGVILGTAGVAISVGGWNASWHCARICN